jgi:hypothetical protein
MMSNHFHLLLQLTDPRQLSACMAGLLRAYVHAYHRRFGFVGHLFQGRFKYRKRDIVLWAPSMVAKVRCPFFSYFFFSQSNFIH